MKNDELDFALNDQLWSDLLDPSGELKEVMSGATRRVETKKDEKVSERIEPATYQITLKTLIAGAIFVMLISGVTSLAVVSTFYANVMR